MSFRSNRLTNMAREHLEPGEVERASVFGTYETVIVGSRSAREGVLIATDRRVLLYGKKVGGHDIASYRYDAITSFEQGRNLMGSTVRIATPSGEVRMKWIKAADDAAAFGAAVHQAQGNAGNGR